MKFRRYLDETCTHKQKKQQGVSTLRDDADWKISAFHRVNFALWYGAVPYKAPQTESLSLRMLKFCQYQQETHTNKQKKSRALQLSGMMQLQHFHRSVSRPGTVLQTQRPNRL